MELLLIFGVVVGLSLVAFSASMLWFATSSFSTT